MNQFSDKDFLLTTPTAKSLFQAVAGLPVIDCHSKLKAEEIAENKQFDNITKLWLDGDIEKQQAMRTFGIDEYYITGEAGDYEKFQKWAETVPYLPGNPLYHRTHLELQRYFGIFEPLSPATAEQIWNRANQIITGGSFSVFEWFKKFNVEAVCTPEDPADELLWHQKLSEEGPCPAKVLPAFCPDTALQIEAPAFLDFLSRLEEACSQAIESYAALQACLVERLLFFKSAGGKTTLQSITSPLSNATNAETAALVFQKAKNNQTLTPEEVTAYQTHLLAFLTKKYQDYGFSMEVRTENASVACSLVSLLETVAKEHKLPKIMIVPKNPFDSGAVAKKILSSDIAGFLRMGGSDGLLYNKGAIKTMLTAAASNGILPLFIGFSADSVSLLSYPSHEYFRRVLADVLGDLVESGEYPNYVDLLKKFAKDIAYENQKQFFGL